MEQLNLKRDKYKDASVLLLMFVLCFALHAVMYFTVFGFSRATRMCWDEVYYYDIARSIFNGDGLSVRGLPIAFQKIGYSLVMMPFFAVKDVALRLKYIGVTNIFIMSLSVIFMWLICTELKLSRRAKYFITFLTAIWHDIMYSMTYMSEVLYWPLTVLFFWLWLVNQRKQSSALSVVGGILCYVMYLTKEVTLAFIVAYAVFEVIYPVLSFMIQDGENRKTLREFYGRKKFILLAVFLAVFTACHVFAKLTLFSGLGGFYNQMGIRAISSPYRFMYCIYAFFYYVAAVLTALFIIPAVYPAVNFRRMNEAGRKFFCYTALFGLVVSATIAYTISVRESLGDITPAVHLRYYGSFFLMMITAFFCSMQNMNPESISSGRRFSAEVLTLAVIYTCFMFRGINSLSSADQYTLLWYMALEKVSAILLSLGTAMKEPSALFPPSGKWQVFYPTAIIATVLFIILAVMFHRIYTRRGKSHAQKFFAAVILFAVLVLNAAVGSVIRYAYRVDGDAVSEIVKINEHFRNDSASNILYLNYGDPHDRYDYLNRYTDTYMDRRHHFYTVNYDDLAQNMSGNSVNTNGITLKCDFMKGDLDKISYKDIRGIDYILVENTNSQGQKKLLNTEPVKELCGKHFTLYRNLNPSMIQFED